MLVSAKSFKGEPGGGNSGSDGGGTEGAADSGGLSASSGKKRGVTLATDDDLDVADPDAATTTATATASAAAPSADDAAAALAAAGVGAGRGGLVRLVATGLQALSAGPTAMPALPVDASNSLLFQLEDDFKALAGPEIDAAVAAMLHAEGAGQGEEMTVLRRFRDDDSDDGNDATAPATAPATAAAHAAYPLLSEGSHVSFGTAPDLDLDDESDVGSAGDPDYHSYATDSFGFAMGSAGTDDGGPDGDKDGLQGRFITLGKGVRLSSRALQSLAKSIRKRAAERVADDNDGDNDGGAQGAVLGEDAKAARAKRARAQAIKAVAMDRAKALHALKVQRFYVLFVLCALVLPAVAA